MQSLCIWLLKLIPIFDECKRENLIVFDVGANTGVWTKALLTHSDKFIDKIYMFEPLIGNYNKILARGASGFYGTNYNKLKILNIGLSNKNTTLTLNHDGVLSGYASFSVDKSEFGPRSFPLSMETRVEA